MSREEILKYVLPVFLPDTELREDNVMYDTEPEKLAVYEWKKLLTSPITSTNEYCDIAAASDGNEVNSNPTVRINKIIFFPIIPPFTIIMREFLFEQFLSKLQFNNYYERKQSG